MTYLIRILGASCPGGDFFGFPKWYKYLDGATEPLSHLCTPQISSINDIYLIVAAVIEMLLRVAALLAVGFVIYGGVEYSISQGEPERTSRARKTIINALVGLAISVTAAAVVAFMAARVK